MGQSLKVTSGSVSPTTKHSLIEQEQTSLAQRCFCTDCPYVNSRCHSSVQLITLTSQSAQVLALRTLLCALHWTVCEWITRGGFRRTDILHFLIRFSNSAKTNTGCCFFFYSWSRVTLFFWERVRLIARRNWTFRWKIRHRKSCWISLKYPLGIA